MYQVIGDASRLHVGVNCVLNNALFNLASGNITLEDNVFFGHNVCLITGSHDYTVKGLDRQVTIPKTGHDITIKQGVWIASNTIIIGPCVIGENSVVSAGCVVHQDIPCDVVCKPRTELVF